MKAKNKFCLMFRMVARLRRLALTIPGVIGVGFLLERLVPRPDFDASLTA